MSTTNTNTKQETMSSIVVLGEVQVLNTIAVDAINERDYEEAHEVLTYAIAQLSCCQLSPTPIGPCKCSNYYGTTSSSSSLDHGVSVYFSLEGDSQNPSIAQGDFFFLPCLYECSAVSLLLPEYNNNDDGEEVIASSQTNEQYCFCAITCLFNLGLCYHLEWNTRGKVDAHLLAKALECYEEAFSLISNCQLSATDSVLQVLLAVCSNAAYCNSELANVANAQRWNKRLCRILDFQRQKFRFRSFFLFSAFFNSFPTVTSPAA